MSKGSGRRPMQISADEFAQNWEMAMRDPACPKHPDQPLLKCEKCREEHWDNYNEKRGPYSETTSD